MKYLLLAKSNVRKTKGLTVGLILLITLASCFLNVFLLINTDFNKNANIIADNLNTEDVYFIVNGDINDINENYIKSIDNNIEDIEITKELSLMTELPYNDAKTMANISIGNESLFNKKIGQFEILDKDNKINNNYIYLPYQFYTGGGYKIGDEFKFDILNNTYKLKVKGFINTITFGSNNVGAYQLIVDNDSYTKIKEDSNGIIDSIVIKCKLRDNVDINKFTNKIKNQILNDYSNNTVSSNDIESAIFGRTFLGIIFGALLLIVCGVALVIVILMISNNISNFIRENIKTLGALKALGYTSKDITISFITQFIIIDLIGSIIGVILSKYLMQMIGDIMVTQSAIPYTAKFIFSTIIITIIALFLIVFISLLLLLRKTKKIEPIIALREGTMDKNSKKNIAPLEKSNISLNMNLSLKTTFANLKQNIITAIICLFLIIMSSLSLILYQNFTIKPKISIMTFEMSDGLITTDSDIDLEIYNYIKNIPGVNNLRLIAINKINVDEIELYTYVLDDPNNLQNKDVVYEGSIPKNNDEIVISGKFAKDYGYAIGDKITIKNGNKEAIFKVTGFMQTLNNNGMEALLSKESIEKVVSKEYDKQYYFEKSDNVELDEIFTKVNNRFGNRIKSTTDYNDLAEGALKTFQTISLAIVILVSIINLSIILLVLYMLIKTLINKKKKDYGILKALGYTSKQIIFQNATSFIPSIAISVIISSIVSCLVMNKLIGIVMNTFGIMRLTFDIPVLLIIIFGIAFILISFILSILLSRKIKKIEPYKLLIGE